MDILAEVAAAIAFGDGVGSSWEVTSSSSRARSYFQWFGTLAAIFFLFILNRNEPRSPARTTLLVFYLLISFPTVLFEILRGQFGRWVGFFAAGANLFFPHEFTVARFLLFIITPDWVVNGLRDSIAGPVICIVIELRGFFYSSSRPTGWSTDCVTTLLVLSFVSSSGS